MQIDHPQNNCQHTGCQCTVEQGAEYCSEHCRRATENAGAVGEEMQDACACGHPECDQP